MITGYAYDVRFKNEYDRNLTGAVLRTSGYIAKEIDTVPTCLYVKRNREDDSASDELQKLWEDAVKYDPITICFPWKWD